MSNQKVFFIYTLSCPKTGAVRYVGATSQKPTYRFLNHKATAKRRNSSLVHKWILSLLDEGLEPVMNIIDSGDVDTWEAKEKYWIQYHKDMGCDLTNSTDGGLNCKHSEKIRKKKSEAMSGENHFMYGKTHTTETRKRMSEAQSGKNNHLYGRYGKDSPKIKPVIQYDKKGKFIRYWDGIIIASRELKISDANICLCCRYNRKSAGGYVWRYADDPLLPEPKSKD